VSYNDKHNLQPFSGSYVCKFYLKPKSNLLTYILNITLLTMTCQQVNLGDGAILILILKPAIRRNVKKPFSGLEAIALRRFSQLLDQPRSSYSKCIAAKRDAP
jgi:hypothetical protein